MREFSSDNQPEIDCTVDFQLVVQKSRRESAHARTLAGILNRKFRACANSRRDFWTTNWKSTVNNYCTPPIEYHELSTRGGGFHEAEGRVKYSLPRVDNHGIQWRGVCNNSFIIHLHRISGGKKIMMKKGKKWRRKENEKKSVAGWI